MPSKDADTPRSLELLTLGGMLRSKDYRNKCLEVLVDADFRDKDCRACFRLLCDVAKKREGAVEELAQLMSDWLGTEGTVGFADRIKEYRTAREIKARLKPLGIYVNEAIPVEAKEQLAKLLERLKPVQEFVEANSHEEETPQARQPDAKE